MSSLIEMTSASYSSKAYNTSFSDKKPITFKRENHQRSESSTSYISQIKPEDLPKDLTSRDRWALFSLLKNSLPTAQDVIIDWRERYKGSSSLSKIKQLAEALLFKKFIPNQKNPWVNELYKNNPLFQDFLEQAVQVENARGTEKFRQMFVNMEDQFKWQPGSQSREINGLILYGDKEALEALIGGQGDVSDSS